jgi:Protein kinase domain
MGQVWVAVDQRDGRRLAAKVLREEMARDPQIVARFVQERSILLALDHPHVVRVRDLVVEGDALAIVMDLVEGSDLRHRLREHGTLTPTEAVTLTAQVLDALAAAHALGILHRDVKPDNVLIGAAGQALLTDFSIARLAQETTVRMTGVLGTAEYIAPEVFESEQVSGAADVYGAGTLLYELLAGRTPFAGGGTGYAIANRHVRSAPPVVPDLDPALQRCLLTLLDKDPTRRPTAAAAAAALQELLPGLDGQPALPVQPEPTSWAQVAGAGPETPLHVAGASAGAGAVDPGQTTVRASAAPAVGPAPVEPGEARWAGPQGDAGPDLSLTQVRAEPRVERSRLDDAVDRRPEEPQQKRSRAVPWVAGVAALALVAGGAALLLTRDGTTAAPQRTAAPVARDLITVALPPQVLPSGLSITREAALDPETSTATTTVTWTAGATPLAGPFYEVVAPVEDGDECPTVAWDATALRDTTEGLAAEACGWRVTTEPLTAGGSATASYDQQLDVPEGEEPSTVLGGRAICLRPAAPRRAARRDRWCRHRGRHLRRERAAGVARRRRARRRQRPAVQPLRPSLQPAAPAGRVAVAHQRGVLGGDRLPGQPALRQHRRP